jgi:energy-coupling factor transporter transmembrane protein EcfT
MSTSSHNLPHSSTEYDSVPNNGSDHRNKSNKKLHKNQRKYNDDTSDVGSLSDSESVSSVPHARSSDPSALQTSTNHREEISLQNLEIDIEDLENNNVTLHNKVESVIRILQQRLKVKSIDTYVFSAFWSMVGLLPAVCYTLYCYLHPVGYNSSSFTRVGIIQEPFAAISNLSFWFCSYGLVVVSNTPNSTLPEQTLIEATLLCLLASGSLLFHINGSQIGSFPNDMDRIGMYTCFTSIAPVGVHGAWHSYTGKTCKHDCRMKRVTTLFALGAVSTTIVYIESFPDLGLDITVIPYFAFFIFGAVIIGCNGITVFYCAKDKTRRIFDSIEYIICLIIQLMTAYYIQVASEDKLNLLWCRGNNPTWCSRESLTEPDEYYQRIRNLYDMQHGFWHFLIATVLTEMILVATTAQVGLYNKNVHKNNKRVLFSISFLFSIVLVILNELDADPFDYVILICVWEVVGLVVSLQYMMDSIRDNFKIFH